MGSKTLVDGLGWNINFCTTCHSAAKLESVLVSERGLCGH